MESIPVCRRTRLQQAIKDKALREEKKKRWFAARSNWRNRVSRDVNLGVVNDDSDDDEEETITVNFVKQNLIVENNQNLGGLDNDQHDNDHDTDKQRKVDHDNNKDSKDIATHCRNNEDSDDSLQIIGERWNPDYCYESDFSVTSSDSCCETMSTHRDIEDEIGQVSGFGWSFSDGNRLQSEGGHNRKRNEGVSPENNAQQNDFVGRRTRSVKKRGDRSFNRLVTIDDGSSPYLDGKNDDHKMKDNHMPENTMSCEKDSVRKKGRPFKTAYVANDSELENNPEICNKPEDERGDEIVGKRKRGRPRKKRIAEKESSPERKMQNLKTNEVENIMLNTTLENGNVGLETRVAFVSEAVIPLKFNLRVHNSLSEKSEEEKETEELFNDLDFALRPCDVGCSTYCPDEGEEDDDVISYENVAVQAKLCRKGKHYLILEDEIGIRCKSCSFVKLEIRDVTPDFDYNPFGRSDKKNHHWMGSLCNGAVSDRLRLKLLP